MPCWWGLTTPKQLSTAATARVIWLCACVRYWPDRGLVFDCVTCFYCRQYPTILIEQAWSIKDLLLIWKLKENCFPAGHIGCSRAGKDRSRAIFTARVANRSARFGSTCPAHRPFALWCLNLNNIAYTSLASHSCENFCLETWMWG